MKLCVALCIFATLLVSVSSVSAAQATPARQSAVMIQFERFADIFGSRLVAAFDSIPAAKYNYRPTPKQQTVGYIAQHLEAANYSFCERFSTTSHALTAKDSLADTVKARWPKDTLVARLRASLHYCDDALDRVDELNSPTLTSTLLSFETDLAEHYSQISTYMRLLGLVPPSALLPVPRATITLPAPALTAFIGTYAIAPGQTLDVNVANGALAISSNLGGGAVRAAPLSATAFYAQEADAEITFRKDSRGAVTGLVLHQYGRDRLARKVK